MLMSVIIPVYNVEKYLAECIESVHTGIDPGELTKDVGRIVNTMKKVQKVRCGKKRLLST